MGKEILKNMKRSVLITGLARNVGSGIEREVNRFESAFDNFNEISFFIVESDSEDNTVSELERLKSSRENFRFVSLGALQTDIPDRVSRIAFCRDIYMQEIRENPIYQKIEFICMVDFDLTNDALSASGIESCFLRSDWCGVFANQTGAYYDIFALRAKNWSEKNCWDSDRILREEGLDPIISQHIAVYSKRRKIGFDAAWIPVESAFGGLGLYKRECISESRYWISQLAESGDCEHVLFNVSLSNQGHKLFINPKLLNFSWNQHNSSERFLNKSKRRIKFFYVMFKKYLRYPRVFL
jgi:hypothetical protein